MKNKSILYPKPGGFPGDLQVACEQISVASGVAFASEKHVGVSVRKYVRVVARVRD